jgi:hypothetical protein
MMKSATLAACISLALAASPAFAGTAPATPPPKPQKLTAVPPPPPPPGPGKFATPTKPLKTGTVYIVILPSAKPPTAPKPIDDFAADTHKPGPVVSGSTFGPTKPPSPPPPRPATLAQ